MLNMILRFGVLEALCVFLVLTNALTFALFAIDKRKAVKNKWRISEKALLTATIVFGGLGAVAAMYFIRHKTQKRKFKITAIIGNATQCIRSFKMTTPAKIVNAVAETIIASNTPTFIINASGM